MLLRRVPKTNEVKVITNQLLRSATSVAANYRATCRARSKPEFIAKLGIVIEEADESTFWLELLGDIKALPNKELEPILKESNELVAIMVTSRKSVLKNQNSKS